MTVLMSAFGIVVFVFSLFTVGFKAAMRRLIAFALIGFTIDILIVAVASAVMTVSQ